MKSLSTLVLILSMPLAALAQSGAPPPEEAQQESAADDPSVIPEDEPAPEGTEEVQEEGLRVLDARDVELAEFRWTNRLIVVFADSPFQPEFRQQMEYLRDGAEAMIARDVIVITDTDPEARTQPRLELRPRGFSLVLITKEGEVAQRKPSPWDAREVGNAIDRLPLRRQEMHEERPSGRE